MEEERPPQNLAPSGVPKINLGGLLKRECTALLSTHLKELAGSLASGCARAEFVLLPPGQGSGSSCHTERSFCGGLKTPPGMLLGVPPTFSAMEVESLSKLNSNL